MWWLCTKVLESEVASLSRFRSAHVPRKPGGIGGCTITEEAQCCGAVGKRHVFPYWLVFEADVVLQRDASHVFWLLQHRDKGP